ncbi:MAG: type IV pilus twitching motility protein PilT [Puniceicoccaceae bacterium]
MAEIDTLLEEMLDQGGSDLHLSANAAPKIRVSGSIRALDYEPFSAELVGEVLREFVPDERWRQFEGRRDVDIAYEIPGRARFRTNLFRNHWGPAAVFRQIPNTIESIDELDLPRVLKQTALLNGGLVLVTGPTGSGKTTTLAAILNHINENATKEIITLEDPIEFVHPDKRSTFIHREITEHSHNYAAALRSAMRADPDVILIGEMRDCETMRLALGCAAMGMLVFGTLHTNGAAKTIDRVIDAFPSEEQEQIRILLAESLRAIVSQLLCADTRGGQVPAFEILTYHQSLPHCIRQNSLSGIRNLMEQSREVGMISLDASLRELLTAGRIDRHEAYMKANDKSAFREGA